MTASELFHFLSVFIFTLIALPIAIGSIAKTVSWAETRQMSDRQYLFAFIFVTLAIIIFCGVIRQITVYLTELLLQTSRPDPTKPVGVSRYRYLTAYHILGGVCGLTIWLIIGKIVISDKRKRSAKNRKITLPHRKTKK